MLSILGGSALPSSPVLRPFFPPLLKNGRGAVGFSVHSCALWNVQGVISGVCYVLVSMCPLPIESTFRTFRATVRNIP